MTLIGNRYDLQDTIGDGAHGTVYRAVDTQTQTVVALKRLKPQVLLSEPALLDRFEREAEALRQLNHPNIVHVIETLQHDQQHYIVMEYISGGSLRQLIQQNGTLTTEQILRIAIELSDALTRAHYLRIVHRDLKPDNILLAEDGTPRLTDFGVAAVEAAEHITGTHAVVGTLSYLSPEALNGQPVDNRGDIWAFGVILFEMAAGERPFTGKSITDTIVNIMTKPAPDLEAIRPDAPIALVDLIYRMLEKDPSMRIPSIRLVGAELEAIMQGSGAASAHPDVIRDHYIARSRDPFATPVKSGYAPDIPKHNLPAQITPFIGREPELRELTRLLMQPDTRLITILGPGGMGKTRLSLEFGLKLIDDYDTSSNNRLLFPNGLYFVTLASLDKPENIVNAIAETVQYVFQHDQRDPETQLLDYLGGKQLLLILDNFEHVLPGADLLTRLLQTAPNVRLIVTSRQRLNLSGETVFNLGGMDFPDWETPGDALEYSAVKLFMQSARRVRPDFELEADDLAYVARICRLVQGLPLGILLAAAWVDALSLREIADEITHNLDFLETDMRDLPERQRSIRAVFDYSWQLVDDKEKQAFSQLSVFRGGFTRKAAQAVTGASLRVLTTLVNKSLLHRDPSSGRYEIHDLLRQYGEEALQADDNRYNDTRDAHSQYYLQALSELSEAIMTAQQRESLERIDNEIDNVRRAWWRAIEQHDLEGLQKAAHTVYVFYRLRSLENERQQIFEAAIAMVEAQPESDLQQRVLGKLLTYHGELFMRLNQWPTAVQIWQRSLNIWQALGEEQGDYVYALAHIGQLQSQMGQLETGIQRLQRAVVMAQRIGDTITEGLSQLLFAMVVNRTHYQDPEEQINRALSLFKELQQPEGMGDANRILAGLKITQGQFDEAIDLLQEAIAYYDEINDRVGIALIKYQLGMAHIALGHYDQAEVAYRANYTIMADLAARTWAGNAANGMCDTYFVQGQYEKALEWNEIAITLQKQANVPFHMGIAIAYKARTLAYMGNTDEALQLLHDFKQQYPNHPVYHLNSLIHRFTADVYLQRGEAQTARQHVLEALKLVMETPHGAGFGYMMLGLTEVALLEKNYERTVYYAAAITLDVTNWHYTLRKMNVILQQCSNFLDEATQDRIITEMRQQHWRDIGQAVLVHYGEADN